MKGPFHRFSSTLDIDWIFFYFKLNIWFQYTKEYCGLFSKAGLMPKKIIGRFFVSPEAVIQPGTPLFAPHYRPGNVVDVGSKT